MNSFKSTDKDGNIYYKNEKGEWHREDGPAFESSNGTKSWWVNGERHREDGPAVIWSDGDCWYFLNDIRYNKDDWEKEIIKIKLERIMDL